MEKSDIRDNVTIKTPQIHESAFIADGARVIGDVILKAESSIWYNTVARADINQIVIGERSNIQDNSVIHLENDQGVLVGNDVTVGHNAIIHGCTIGDGALIGMGAIIMNGVSIGKGAVVGAGAVVKENMIVNDYELVVGVPAKVVKTLSSSTYDDNVKWAKKYVQLANIHKNNN
jgi:carbonic anhydrase/acetyltransferase-like protein (isoleucine patch superfamily)|tara:strand:- start:1466 stop:1990 length:525 start_codon:yes stop_codon:yes gene_type:complete